MKMAICAISACFRRDGLMPRQARRYHFNPAQSELPEVSQARLRVGVALSYQHILNFDAPSSNQQPAPGEPGIMQPEYLAVTAGKRASLSNLKKCQNMVSESGKRMVELNGGIR
jgi:hypothetical protein